MTKPKKERLDAFLTEKGFFESRSQAQASIMAGDVRINGETVTKAGFQVSEKDSISVETDKLPYVSRGGFKLEKAIQEFNINVKDKICLDAGASTGGFTDCLLQNGAEKVYAVDVGYGQLAWKLRNDPKVIVIERTNIRNCSVNDVYGEKYEIASFAVMDLSFISVTKVLENIKKLLSPASPEIITLIKPQFEAGRELVPKTGVIKDKAVHVNVIKNVLDFACNFGLFPVNLTYSPVKGPAGNIEYLAYFSGNSGDFTDENIETVVNKAHENLNSDKINK
jgi:23S rRNA (cytidine1920-2'-O)/16S rRNA (cytidine1409-2'-O)-methyltransferase